MKKKHKIMLAIVSIIIVVTILGVISFFTYRRISENKILEKGIHFMDGKEYDKALVLFDLDYKSKNKEALEYKDMIKEYLYSKKLFNENKVEEAKNEIKKINSNYVKFYGLKDDVDNLEIKIDDSMKKISEFNKIKELIKKKDSNEATKLLKDLEKEKLNLNEKKEIKKIKDEIKYIEDEKINPKEAKRIKKEKEEILENKSHWNTFYKAVQLVNGVLPEGTDFIYEGIMSKDKIQYYQFLDTDLVRYAVPLKKSDNVYLVVSNYGEPILKLMNN